MSVPPKKSFWSDLATLPNLLSLGRILAIYLAIALYWDGARVAGVGVGFLAGVTDLFDGYLARRLNRVTRLGETLDRLSDLIFESTNLLFALYMGFVPLVLVLAYLLREFVVISARLHLAEKAAGIPTLWIGRLKTNIFSYAILVLYAAHSGVFADQTVSILHNIALGTLVGGVVISYVAAGSYLRAFVRQYLP